MTPRRRARWDVGLLATAGLVGVGLLYANPVLLTAAVIPLTYVLYGALSSVADEPSLSAERSIDTPTATPGDPVAVTLTLYNDSGSVLPDVRILDGVPPGLSVSDGSPRACVSLLPGESTTLSYTVLAKRGEYSLSDPVVRLRSLAGDETRPTEVVVEGATRVVGSNAVDDVPVGASLPHAGTLPTDAGGSGVEFYATREYRPGDPVTQINWNQVAKTGDYVTVQYRNERALRTVVVVDARPVGRVTPSPGYPTAAELSSYAANRLHDSLASAGAVASVAAVGFEAGTLDGLVGHDGVAWAGSESRGNGAHRPGVLFRRIQAAIETAPPDTSGVREARSPSPTDGGVSPDSSRISALLARLPPTAQVVVCSPVLDDWPVSLVRALSDRSYRTLVVGPEITTGETVGRRLASIDRRLRLRRIERAGGKTVSWNVEQPIEYALRRSLPHLHSR